MGFELDPSYKQVPERIADFKAKHPEGCLQPADLTNPYRVEIIGDRAFVVYTAAAYRTPDDLRPGIGIAWEPFPGKTPYTKDSELMNAETSAWGRAIVAVLASESKSVASAEDVRNRQADHADNGGPPTEDERKGRAWARQRVVLAGGVQTEIAVQITERLSLDNKTVEGAEALAAALEKFAATGELPPEPTPDEPQEPDSAPEPPSLAQSLRNLLAAAYSPTAADTETSADAVEERRVLLSSAAALIEEKGWTDKDVLAVVGSKKKSVAKHLGEIGIADLRMAVDMIETAAKA